MLRDRGGMAILLVEQYYDFVREVAQHLAVMDRSNLALAGRQKSLDETEIRRNLSM